jgi:hypothetical protein
LLILHWQQGTPGTEFRQINYQYDQNVYGGSIDVGHDGHVIAYTETISTSSSKLPMIMDQINALLPTPDLSRCLTVLQDGQRIGTDIIRLSQASRECAFSCPPLYTEKIRFTSDGKYLCWGLMRNWALNERGYRAIRYYRLPQ